MNGKQIVESLMKLWNTDTPKALSDKLGVTKQSLNQFSKSEAEDIKTKIITKLLENPK